MQRYILNRVLLAVPTVLGITILIFLAMRVLPGDPLALIISESSGTYVLSEEELQAARASLGLDKPYHLQYLDWMAQVLSGDLGTSFWTKEPIRDLILRRGSITAQIAVMAVIFSWLIGVPIGMLSAMWRNSLFDHLSRLGITIFIAVPSFWVGLLIILATVLWFTWRPPLTIVQIWEDPGANLAMAVGWTLLGYLLVAAGVEERFFLAMCRAGVMVNLVMFAFNLFPLPPLDGGRILVGLLPWRQASWLARVEPWGFFIVMALVISGIVGALWLRPLMGLTGALIDLLLTPLRLLLF